jgi:hypothetical protein
VSSWRKRRTELPIATDGDLDWLTDDEAAAPPAPTPEEAQALEEDDQFASAAIAEIRHEFEEKNDINAWMAFDLMLEGKGKVEVMQETGMSEKEYLAAYKKIQRRIKALKDRAASKGEVNHQ